MRIHGVFRIMAAASLFVGGCETLNPETPGEEASEDRRQAVHRRYLIVLTPEAGRSISEANLATLNHAKEFAAQATTLSMRADREGRSDLSEQAKAALDKATQAVVTLRKNDMPANLQTEVYSGEQGTISSTKLYPN